MIRNIFTVLILGYTLFITACSQEERNKRAGKPLSMEDSIMNKMDADSGRLIEADKQFVEQVAMSAMVEVAAGKLAQEKSEKVSIQNFGSLLVKHHEQLAKDLRDVVAQRAVVYPTEIDSLHQKKLNALASEAPDAFEKAFLQMVIDDHQQSSEVFTATRQHGKDVHIKSFANKNFPIINKHLQIAEELSEQR
ncbi:DUF4142 domain-containing protein [Olivibacter sp. SDN3]|uniref:DUF4142 domain-containing protein n=1 Tax=Olivibacter sp. SDN3 TaxID=2764720 RepID=UPI00165168A2|nr:DUF4142 domain-containing protein [Olivibacter sp. SDN3]QNL49062.1 DUF4142 domain-containing protein [Olivibacter sp. SDN3]